MTDLNTKIADVRRKAVAWRDINFSKPDYWRVSYEWRNIDPDLIIQMADRIEELEKALKPFAACFTKYQTKYMMANEDYNTEPLDAITAYGLLFGHLRTASRALNGEKQ